MAGAFALKAAAWAAAHAARCPASLARRRMQRSHDGEPARQLIDGVVLHVAIQQSGFLPLRERVLVAIRHRTVQRDHARRDQQRAVRAGQRVGQRCSRARIPARRPANSGSAFSVRCPSQSDRIASGFSDGLTITVSLPPSTMRSRRATISGAPPDNGEPLERVVLLAAQLEAARGQQQARRPRATGTSAC